MFPIKVNHFLFDYGTQLVEAVNPQKVVSKTIRRDKILCDIPCGSSTQDQDLGSVKTSSISKIFTVFDIQRFIMDEKRLHIVNKVML